MIAAVAERTADIQRLCGRHHVQRLAVFGSAATGEHRSGTSDFDFVVEFPSLPAGAYADSYFGLLEDLERLLGGRWNWSWAPPSGTRSFASRSSRPARYSMKPEA